ncbi:MAG: hypothetical protein Kow00129_15500 [Thermoleophilia bacterium]
MSSTVFGRRTNLIVILIAAAIFFTTLGFFLATGVDRPPSTSAQEIWTEGSGFSDQEQDGPNFAPIAKQMRRTVVRLEVGGRSLEGALPVPDDEPHEDIPDGEIPEGHPEVPSEGSGVIISEDGYILTNNHVIDGGTTITVFLADGDSFEATVVGTDARDDLALIKVEADGPLPVAPLGDSDEMEIGDWVMAMGNPLGFEYSATVGVVSGKGRALPASNFRDFIQTDAAIYPGNSGGPLFNLAGEVIGINTAVIPDTNLGFAVPINSAKEILPALLEEGRVTRGYLGVTILDADELPEPPEGADAGAAVQAVHEGAPAFEAGFRPGDVIVEFADEAIDSADTLTRVVTGIDPGTKVTAVVVRAGERVELEVTVGELPAGLE